MNEKVILWVSREARSKAKLAGTLEGKYMSQWVEELIKKESDKVRKKYAKQLE